MPRQLGTNQPDWEPGFNRIQFDQSCSSSPIQDRKYMQCFLKTLLVEVLFSIYLQPFFALE